MKIAVLSDQHGSLPEIPPCDLMVISGDLCGGPHYEFGHWWPEYSNEKWLEWLLCKFAKWCEGTPTVCVAGNHDTAIARFGFPEMKNVTYLQDSSAEINGLKFWGSPRTRWFDGLAFNVPEKEMPSVWAAIPEGTDVLVCHMPPTGVNACVPRAGDVGCPHLNAAVQRVRPRLLTCGHIHQGRGIYDLHGTKVVNAAGAFFTVDL